MKITHQHYSLFTAVISITFNLGSFHSNYILMTTITHFDLKVVSLNKGTFQNILRHITVALICNYTIRLSKQTIRLSYALPFLRNCNLANFLKLTNFRFNMFRPIWLFKWYKLFAVVFIPILLLQFKKIGS